MAKEIEKLLVEVINLIAERFADTAILAGGMSLRVMGSSRYTNDLDYIFSPFKSKNDIVEILVDAINSLSKGEVTYSLNSKCLRIRLSLGGKIIQVEAKVAKQVKAIPASTKLIADNHGVQKRIIQIIDPALALANKLAAWNERRLMRDLYDIWFYLKMNTKPDKDALRKRLKKPIYSRLVKPEERFTGQDVSEFYEFIRKKAAELDDQDFINELSGILPTQDLVGFAMMLRSTLVKLD